MLRYACEAWCVPGFDIVRGNSDAKDLFDLSFAPVRESYAAFEELLIEILQAYIPAPESRVAASDLAHMIGCAMKGFKDVASETSELRRLIGTLADVVGEAVTARIPVDG